MADGPVEGAKQSGQKLIAWAKKHPALAAAIVGGVILLAYLASRRSAGAAQTATTAEEAPSEGGFTEQVGGDYEQIPPLPAEIIPPITTEAPPVTFSEAAPAATWEYAPSEIFGPQGMLKMNEPKTGAVVETATPSAPTVATERAAKIGPGVGAAAGAQRTWRNAIEDVFSFIVPVWMQALFPIEENMADQFLEAVSHLPEVTGRAGVGTPARGRGGRQSPRPTTAWSTFSQQVVGPEKPPSDGGYKKQPLVKSGTKKTTFTVKTAAK